MSRTLEVIESLVRRKAKAQRDGETEVVKEIELLCEFFDRSHSEFMEAAELLLKECGR